MVQQRGGCSAGFSRQTVLALALLAAFGVASCQASDTAPPKSGSGQAAQAGASELPAGDKPGAADRAGRKVVARVNGEAIYESDLSAGLPQNAFAERLETAREMKLDRLIRTLSVRQFLKGQKIEVEQKEIDAEIAKLRKYPPSAGCACCRYKSLEEFLTLNSITLAEMATMCWNQIGMGKYLDAQWQKSHGAPEEVAKMLKAARPELEKRYIKAYHIFFNVYQDPDYGRDSEGVEQKKLKLAEAAWARLEKGESFAAVAKAVSEDQMSGQEGGYLGYVTADVFGKEFGKVLLGLKPGVYSKPIVSPWGVHITKREALTDDDILTLLKDDFKSDTADETFARIDREAKIERADEAGGESGPAKAEPRAK